MTTAEKQDAIREHCDKEEFCGTCPARKVSGAFCDDEKTVDKVYSAIFPDAKTMIVKKPDTPVHLFDHTAYEKAIINLLHKQTEKGLDKYGETLEDNATLTTEQRIEHLQEELIDALQYCEHLKAAYKDHMTANDYQRAALRTAGEKPENYLDNAILGLCGEVGEVADIIKKHRHQGHELNREHLIEELGDVCWYVALMASALELPLEEVLQRNVDKLKKRYPDGFDKARSINRREA